MYDQHPDDEQRREALSDFLRTRRARLAPGQVGLPEGGRRRTPGLRREEVAQIAGVSTDWYTYLEQGRDVQASKSVLASIANALQLTVDEKLHFFALANQPLVPDVAAPMEIIPPVFQQVLDALGETPAYITGRRCDILAWNQAASAVFVDFGALAVGERNLLWLLFTNAALKELFVDWAGYAQEVISVYRAAWRSSIGDPRITQLIDRLSSASAEFRGWWSQHDVQQTCAVQRELNHPQLGRLKLAVAIFQVNGNPDVQCCVYPAADEETQRKLHHLRRDTER